MTRAKLHLELVATVADLERTKWELALPPSDSRVREAGSMITWVMQAISTDAHTKSTNYPQASTPWDCRDWDELPQKTVDKVGETEADASKVLSLLQTAPPEGVFPEKTVQTDILPLKTSVSALVKKQADALPLSDAEEDDETKHAVDANGTPLLLSELPRRPAFMEEKRMTAAERGTLTHAAGNLGRVFVPKFIETVGFQQLVGMCHRVCLQAVANFQSEQYILADGAPFQQIVLLQHIADMRRNSLHRFTADGHLSGGGRKQTRDNGQKGGFSATARSDDAVKIARVH